jgi:hypothetical protein
MTIWCCISPNRTEKSGRVMKSLAAGWPGARVVTGPPPDDGNLFICFGQIWLAEDLIKKAIPEGRKFFQVDNGFWKPSRGQPHGYYRLMYSRPDPVLVTDLTLLKSRMRDGGPDIRVDYKPVRQEGEHVLVAMPGEEFGRAHGLDMRPWMKSIVERVRKVTKRRVIVRDRMATSSLSFDLRHCWAVVTHSSNVAVDAILAGIPVFVEPTSMAAPVGNLSLDQLEAPIFPSEDLFHTWWASLMCQQFTHREMQRGDAHFYLSAIHGLPVTGTVQ